MICFWDSMFLLSCFITYAAPFLFHKHVWYYGKFQLCVLPYLPFPIQVSYQNSRKYGLYSTRISTVCFILCYGDDMVQFYYHIREVRSLAKPKRLWALRKKAFRYFAVSRPLKQRTRNAQFSVAKISLSIGLLFLFDIRHYFFSFQ